MFFEAIREVASRLVPKVDSIVFDPSSILRALIAGGLNVTNF